MAPHKVVIPLSRAAHASRKLPAGPPRATREWTVVSRCRPDLLSVVADEGSSDLRAGRRRPLIDRSPSRIGNHLGSGRRSIHPSGSGVASGLRDPRRKSTQHDVSPLFACNRRPARGGTRPQLHTQTATAVLCSRGGASSSSLRELTPSLLKTLCR